MGQVERIINEEKSPDIWRESLKERENVEDKGVDGNQF